MNATVRQTFASLLLDSAPDAAAAPRLQKLSRQALIPLTVAGGLLSLWMFAAPLSGAIVAIGKLKVELNRKTVQHQEGGLVRKILVRDGELVRAGQPLVIVGDVRTDAELSLLQDQLDAERIRSARTAAEANGASTFDAPSDLTAKTAAREHLARETALFAARRRTLDEYVASLTAQMRDAQDQAAALTAQIATTGKAAGLAQEEFQLNEKLVREGFVQRTRLLQLQRDEADYRSRLSESQSNLSVARQRIGELRARIAGASREEPGGCGGGT